jgi:hypothetical protein
VQFTSSEAGRYYYAVAAGGANAPTIATGGSGAACAAGENTITVYMTSGAKDVYIKVRDAGGNVSAALKISVPAYAPSAQPETPAPTPEPEPPDGAPNENGGIVYQNPDFPSIVIKFGNY